MRFITTALCALLIAPAFASAHTLSLSRAKHQTTRRAAGTTFAKGFTDFRVGECERISRHSVTCPVHYTGPAGEGVCDELFNTHFRSSVSERLRVRLVWGAC